MASQQSFTTKQRLQLVGIAIGTVVSVVTVLGLIFQAEFDKLGAKITAPGIETPLN